MRLDVSGDYSTEVTDHKHIRDLPDGFPNVDLYSTQLERLRDDRNLCDYDHTAVPGDLVLAPAEALDLVRSLFRDAREFFSSRGLDIQGGDA